MPVYLFEGHNGEQNTLFLQDQKIAHRPRWKDLLRVEVPADSEAIARDFLDEKDLRKFWRLIEVRERQFFIEEDE